MKRTLAPLLLLPASLALESCCCCSGCPESVPLAPEEQALQDAKRRVDMDAMESGLMAVAASPPSSRGLTEKGCPDEEIGAKDSSYRQVLTVDREFLVHLADPDFDASDDDNTDWAWLRSEPLREPSKGTDKYTDDQLSSDRQRHYLAIFDSSDKAAPEVDGSGTFTPGHFDGWLIIVDLMTQQTVCQAQLQARSSPRLADAQEGSIRERQEEADEDFQDQLDTQAQAALERISDQLRITLDWTN